MKDLDKSIALVEKNKLTIKAAIDEVLPRSFELLGECETADQANEIRSKLETIHTYIKRKLPKDRKRRLSNNNKWAKAYLTASRIAGSLWREAEHFEGRPPEKREGITAFTAQEMGFSDRFDARRCEKISLLSQQDFELYLKECNENARQATISGLAGVYDLLHPKTIKGEKVEFNIAPTFERLSKLAEKAEKLLPDLAGDSHALVTTGIESFKQAVEIEEHNAREIAA